MLFVISILLFYLGVRVFDYTKSLWWSFLLQLTPFSTPTVFGSFLLVSPETFLIIVSLLFLIAFLPVIYSEKLTKKNIITLSLITGLGIATKLTFVPLFLIPFIVFPKWRQKFLFSALSLLFFLLFISPALIHFDYLIDWINKLIFKKGRYGGGETGIVDTSKFILNFKSKLIYEKTLTLGLIFTFFTWAFFKFIKKQNSLKLRFIIASVAGVFLQLFLSSKDIHLRYLVSGLIVITGVSFISLEKILNFYVSKEIKGQYIVLSFLLLFAVFKLDDVFLMKDRISESKREYEEFNSIIKDKYPKGEYLHLLGYRSTSQAYALHYGSLHAGHERGKYWKILKNLYPDTYLYPWIERTSAYTWSDTLSNFSDIYSENRKILFWGNHLPEIPVFITKAENDSTKIESGLVYKLNGQRIYFIEVKPITNNKND